MLFQKIDFENIHLIMKKSVALASRKKGFEPMLITLEVIVLPFKLLPFFFLNTKIFNVESNHLEI